jgi:hypothetical protein
MRLPLLAFMTQLWATIRGTSFPGAGGRVDWPLSANPTTPFNNTVVGAARLPPGEGSCLTRSRPHAQVLPLGAHTEAPPGAHSTQGVLVVKREREVGAIRPACRVVLRGFNILDIDRSCSASHISLLSMPQLLASIGRLLWQISLVQCVYDGCFSMLDFGGSPRPDLHRNLSSRRSAPNSIEFLLPEDGANFRASSSHSARFCAVAHQCCRA